MGAKHRCPACNHPSAEPIHPGCHKRMGLRELRLAKKAKEKAAAEAAAAKAKKKSKKKSKDSAEEKPEGNE